MEQQVIETQEELWATVELMGHGQTAGRVTKPTEWGGLMRVDVPTEDGYRTEFYSMNAIYSVKFVSEEIARAFAPKERDIVSYNTPIVTREQHDSVRRALQGENTTLRMRIDELERRLTAVKALPNGEQPEQEISKDIPF